MKLVFLGAPGAGKGTQAKLLSDELSLAHISTGEMLRAAVKAQTTLGKQVGDIMDSGQLVPDNLIVSLIKERVKETDCQQGYILDGFPRTVPQAESLAEMLSNQGESITSVVLFDVTEEDVLARLKHRQETEGRADDTVEVQMERLRVYRELTAPLIDYYKKTNLLKTIEASGSIEEVYSKLLSALK